MFRLWWPSGAIDGGSALAQIIHNLVHLVRFTWTIIVFVVMVVVYNNWIVVVEEENVRCTTRRGPNARVEQSHRHDQR